MNQKPDQPRKIRKLLSPKHLDPSSPLEFRTSPHHPLPKRSGSSSQHLTLKHRQAVGSRKHVKNGKEEALISGRRGGNGREREEIRMEYEGYGPIKERKQKKQFKFRVGSSNKSFRSYKSSKSLLQKKDQAETERAQERARTPSIGFSLLKQQLKEREKENRELMARNRVLNIQLEHMGDQIRREFQGRIKEMEKENTHNQNDLDRTVIAQAENKKHKAMVEEMKNTIKGLTQSNQELKMEVNMLKKAKDELEERTKQMQANIQILENENLMKEQKFEEERNEREKKSSQQKQLTNKLFHKITQLQKRLQNNNVVPIFKQKDEKRVRDLQKVVSVQTVSLGNYARDLEFLQGKVVRWKLKYEQLTRLLNEVNEKCMKDGLHSINQKYSS